MDVEQPLLAEQARHAPGMSTQPGEELRVEGNLAVTLEQDDGERAGHSADLASPTLDRGEVAQLLIEDPAEHDPGDSHRPCARQRLGRRARAADDDLPGRRDVDRPRTQLLVMTVDSDHQLAMDRVADPPDALEPRAGDRHADMRAGDLQDSPRHVAEDLKLGSQGDEQGRSIGAAVGEEDGVTG